MNHILEYLPYPVSRDPVLFPTYTCIYITNSCFCYDFRSGSLNLVDSLTR